jgi:sulfatase-modifying factor enzyme 1
LALRDSSFAAAAKCPHDMVQVGPICVDKFEASVWVVDPANTALIKKVKTGTATEAGLIAGGATQGGVGDSGYPCNADGNDCSQIFALSIPGVTPSVFITWFQAQQACFNSGKRLLTNAEWQAAAAGTPALATDNGTTDCHVGGAPLAPVDTGSRSACVSRFGVFDMVGNVEEWVADWVPASSGGCAAPLFGFNLNCLGLDTHAAGTTAVYRGGRFGGSSLAGVFAINGANPSLPVIAPFDFLGFRCGR